jgi:hypothetical protein
MRRSRRLIAVVGLAIVVLAGVAIGVAVLSEPKSSLRFTQTGAWFADITEEVGLQFTHDAGPVGAYFMPQIMGSGAAFVDFDQDELLDVYLLQNGGAGSKSRNQLFRQLPGGAFQDVTDASGLGLSAQSMGTAVGDVNNDGWPDVLVTSYGGVSFFVNQGDGTFRDATKESNLHCPGWGTSACFFDFDRDGWLDLVIACYVDYDRDYPCATRSGQRDYCTPSVFPGTPTRLFRNQGSRSGVRFQDVTVASGLASVPGPGLGVVCFDADGDGWPDIFVANDSQANRLWMNQGDGTFREEAMARGAAVNAMGQAQANMGIALGDMDGDRLLDLFVTHLTEETHTYWKQGPRGLFADRTLGAGLANPHWRGTGFGTVCADFDQDGWPDLAVVNGRVIRAPELGRSKREDYWQAYVERNQIFANDGAGSFRDISLTNEAFCAPQRIARGLVAGVLRPEDQGAVALLVTTVHGPARLYRNVAPKRGHWLLVRALVPCPPQGKAHRDAYGALVTVHAGEHAQVRLVNPAYSYLGSGDPRAHFGLGTVAQVDAIDVDWPDGTSEVFAGGPADRIVTVRQGEGRRRQRLASKQP